MVISKNYSKYSKKILYIKFSLIIIIIIIIIIIGTFR